MKRTLALTSLLVTIACATQAANTSVKLSNVHLCCNGCVKGAEKAVSAVSGASAACDKDLSTVIISAPDKATAQKAVDALVTGGYFGTSTDAGIKVKARSGAKKAKVQSLKVTGVHLCCGKCVSGVTDALAKVDGVKGNTATKGAESFEITGDFSGKEAIAALNKAGFSGKVAK